MHPPLRPPPLRPPPDAGRRRHAVLRVLVLALCSALWLGGPARAQIGPLEDLDKFPTGKLEIADGKKTRHVFDVWLADTPRRQAQGLMFVRSLAPARGMLFVHREPRVLTMWMKNTYIPLDMLFIDEKARIVTVVENTTPHSEAVISSGKPAVAVLELAGGEAKRLGLRAGQRVSHPALHHR
jgi:uncharacterized protein